MKTKRNFIIYLVSASILFFVIFFSLMAGNIFISPVEMFKILFLNKEGTSANIFYYSRLPRTFGAIFSGLALSVSGAILQNVLSNKLASPSIIGVNAGAGLGVTICCGLGLFSGWVVSIFSFMGSILAVLIISIFASKTMASKTTVILTGVALNAILGAFSEAISVLDEDIALLTTEFRVGGFSAISTNRLIPALIIICITFIILTTLLNELDIISIGDDTAKSVGLNVKFYRILFLIISALLAGAAVSYTGLLGFVGLIVPHFVKKIIGNESKKFIPLTAILGGAFVCFCDTISRLLFSPYELPVGIIMAFIGGPLFVFILIKSKGGHSSVKN